MLVIGTAHEHIIYLGHDQYYQIYGATQAGISQSQIATLVGALKSTTSSELVRNQGLCGCHPKQAQAL